MLKPSSYMQANKAVLTFMQIKLFRMRAKYYVCVTFEYVAIMNTLVNLAIYMYLHVLHVRLHVGLYSVWDLLLG